MTAPERLELAAVSGQIESVDRRVAAIEQHVIRIAELVAGGDDDLETRIRALETANASLAGSLLTIRRLLVGFVGLVGTLGGLYAALHP